jgi:hypothetical protein
VIDRARRGDEAFAAVIRLPAEPRSGFSSYCSRKRHLTRTFRDEVLGAALRELEAPEHRPEFYPELNRLLAREQAARRRERRRGPRVRWAPRVALVTALVTETFRGEFRRQIRIEEPALDPPFDRDSSTLEFPPDARPNELEHGFRRVELGEVVAAVGYNPLVPAWLPEGYRPAGVAVHPGTGSPTGVEGSNPPSTDAVSAFYRRGLDQVLVTTRCRDVPGLPDSWSDPLATGEGYRDRAERVSLGRGALSGVEARLLLVPRNVPHLWALTDELVVTVSGDLSRAELVRVAESLEPPS